MKKPQNFARSFGQLASVALLLLPVACAEPGLEAELTDGLTDELADNYETYEEDGGILEDKALATITHVGTNKVYDYNGQDLSISRPSTVQAGDLLILALHRTDDYLPLKIEGWTRAAECYKHDNGYQCDTAATCTSWSSDGNFCKSFQGRGGRDLAQTIFYHVAGSSGFKTYTFDLNYGKTSGHPSWATLTALRGAATSSPVRASANKGCDGSAASVFPSVYGQAGDMLLLSQSFDDDIAQSKFGPPSGTTLFGYINGHSGPAPDETGFLFGRRLTSTGDTGKMSTIGEGGPGGQSCKDAMISLTIKPKTI